MGSNVLIAIPSVILIFGAFWASFKWVISPIRKLISKYTSKIDIIFAELHPNGGNSLKDAVTIIKKSVVKQEMWQRARLSHDETAFFDADDKFSISWVNKSFMRLFGTVEQDILGHNIRNHIDSVDREKFSREQEFAVRNSNDLKVSFRITDAQSMHKCIFLEALAVKDTEGKVIGWAGTLSVKESGFCADNV